MPTSSCASLDLLHSCGYHLFPLEWILLKPDFVVIFDLDCCYIILEGLKRNVIKWGPFVVWGCFIQIASRLFVLICLLCSYVRV